MATRRRSTRPAPSGVPATKRRTTSSEAPGDAAPERRAGAAGRRRAGAGLDLAPYLAHLGPNPGARPPSLPVRVLLLEAERLRKAAQANATPLKKLPGFAVEHLRDLPALIARLGETETAWGRVRFAKTLSSRGALRREAEALRSAVLSAGRYLLRRDPGAQAEIARIAEGEGLADLVQDLDDLADFVEGHAATFALDRRLPKKTTERARGLAAELREVAPDDGGAMRARNVAAAALDFVLGEVRAAARYLFSDDPRKLAPFLSRYEALRSRRARARRKGGAAQRAASTLTTAEA